MEYKKLFSNCLYMVNSWQISIHVNLWHLRKKGHKHWHYWHTWYFGFVGIYNGMCKPNIEIRLEMQPKWYCDHNLKFIFKTYTLFESFIKFHLLQSITNKWNHKVDISLMILSYVYGVVFLWEMEMNLRGNTRTMQRYIDN